MDIEDRALARRHCMLRDSAQHHKEDSEDKEEIELCSS